MTIEKDRYYIMKRFFAVFSVLLVLLLGGCTPQDVKSALGASNDSSMTSSMALDDKAPLAIHMLNIGQGDAILIRSGKDFSLIDAGDVSESSRHMLMTELDKYGVKELKNIIISHPHADHYGGVIRIAKRIKIDKIYDNGLTNNNRSFHSYQRVIDQKKIPHAVLSEGDVVNLGNGVKFDVLASSDSLKIKPEDLNNSSIVGRLTYKKFSMLFTGDAEREEEAYLTKKYNTKLASTVLKVGHHGSKTSSTNDFLAAVRPTYALISAGVCNQYNLPKPEAMQRVQNAIQKFHKNLNGENTIYRTDEDGTISLYTDGDSLTIKTEKKHRNTLNLERKHYEECKDKNDAVIHFNGIAKKAA